MKHQVQPVIIVNNKIRCNINLLVITNVNSIVMIEQQRKFISEIFMIGVNEKHGSNNNEITTSNIKHVPIITFGNEQQYRDWVQIFLLVVLWL